MWICRLKRTKVLVTIVHINENNEAVDSIGLVHRLDNLIAVGRVNGNSETK